jgi:hypothetical protein
MKARVTRDSLIMVVLDASTNNVRQLSSNNWRVMVGGEFRGSYAEMAEVDFIFHLYHM